MRLLLVNIVLLIINVSLTGQNCRPPVINVFQPINPTEVEVSWIDINNPKADAYQVRYAKANDASNELTISEITEQNITLSNLASGNDYNIYIRSKCGEEDSNWNGPFTFSTPLDNAQSCGLNLNIKDNGCPNVSEFPIYVSDVSDSQFLQSIDLVIEHPWPADCKMALISPLGQTVELVNHQGTFTTHFGNPELTDCTMTARFSDEACEYLKNGITSIVGDFKPLTPFHNVNSETNGVWRLQICDRAEGDVGYIRHVSLNFGETTCAVPTITAIEDITDTSVKITWQDIEDCNRIVINYIEAGQDPINGTLEYVECPNDTLVLTELTPNTTYDFYIAQECAPEQLSAFSCSYFVQTLCKAPILVESFDALDSCAQFCNATCTLNSSWTNDSTDDIDWLSGRDETPTPFTGPSGDIINTGGYLYIENQVNACGVNAIARLISPCVRVLDDTDQCDFHFYYHMLGTNINTLIVTVIDPEGTEKELWSLSGNQGNEWHSQYIDVSDYAGQIVQIAITATTGDGEYGDIAIDQPSFIGLDPFDEELKYYQDSDNDGFGNEDEIVFGCQYGDDKDYSKLSGDCDDTNPEINPNQVEIVCNGIDDNCNGIDDDISPNGLSADNIIVAKATCGQSPNGAITLQISGGSTPYEAVWSNGDEGLAINSLTEGYYATTVSDQNGCSIIVDSLYVGQANAITYTIIEQRHPLCLGNDNGSIRLLSNNANNTIKWNTGQTTFEINNLKSGTYSATITDSNGCNRVTAPIELNYEVNQLAGVQYLKNVSCPGGSDGRIILNAINTSNLDYIWSIDLTGNQIVNASAGNYSVSISQSNTGCYQVINDIEITEPEPLSYKIDDIGQNICEGEEQGSIFITAQGGTPPYSHSWNNGAFTDDISNLPPGEYQANISDSRGCSMMTEVFTLAPPPPITIVIEDVTSSECIGSKDGAINLSTSGGTGNLQYLWNTGDTTESIVQQSTGIYTVTVVDDLGCKEALRNIEIPTLGNTFSNSVIVNSLPQCHNDSLGSIIVSNQSEYPPFDYNWSNGIQHISAIDSDTLRKVNEGTFNVTITDNVGCTSVSESLIITQPDTLSYFLLQRQNISCTDQEDGLIALRVNGGTNPVDIVWSSGQTTFDITSLTADNYQATLTDANDCEIETAVISITEPSLLSINHTTTTASANQLGTFSYEIIGGTSPYQIMVSNNSYTATMGEINLAAGDYTATVIDANGCETSLDVTIELVDSVIDDNEVDPEIYPNPTQKSLHIVSSEPVTSISITGIDGMKKQITLQNEILDLATFPPGIYIITVTFRQGYTVAKRIVKL